MKPPSIIHVEWCGLFETFFYKINRRDGFYYMYSVDNGKLRSANAFNYKHVLCYCARYATTYAEIVL